MHLSVCLLVICIPFIFLKKCLFKSLVHLFIFLLLSFKSSLYIVDARLLSDICLLPVGCLFTLLIARFDTQKFSIVDYALMSHVRKHYLVEALTIFAHVFFKRYVEEGLTLRP